MMSYHTIAMMLNQFAATGTYFRAALRAHVTPSVVAHYRGMWDGLEELFIEAEHIYRARLQDTIHDRAVNGWEEPVYYRGEQVGSVRRYSDRLLELQVKRHMPEYREKNDIHVSVNAGVLSVDRPAGDVDQWIEQNEVDNVRKVASEVSD